MTPTPSRPQVGDRTVVAIACTHAHDDHVRSAPELGGAALDPGAPAPDDRVLWDLTHARHEPDGALRDGQVLEVAGTRVQVLHTPGHAPGAVCFSVPDLGVVLSATRCSAAALARRAAAYSDYPTILDSIRTRLFTLPPETRVLTGHGDETTVAAEAPSYDEWVRRGG
jgi:hydroxyacylglutathione hydrolase